MSYMQFQQECKECHKTWNAAFGIVGTTQIAAPPEKCPHCGCTELETIADHWTPPVPTPFGRIIFPLISAREFYSDQEIADRLLVSVPTLQNWGAGLNLPNDALIPAIVQTLELMVNEGRHARS
jgi:hypothetical protein